MSVTAALIGAGVGLGSAALSRYFKKRDEKEMLDYQNKINRQNWYMENAYNHPTAQMERLRAAGLNPNLVYASGNPVGSAGSVESPSYTDMSNDFGSVGANAMNSYYRSEELENQQSQVESIVAYRETLDQLNKLLKEREAANQPYYDKNAASDSSAKRADADVKSLTADKMSKESEFWYDNALQDNVMKAQAVKLNKLTMDNLSADTRRLKSLANLTDTQREHELKKMNLTQAQYDKVYAEISKLGTEQWQIIYQAGLNSILADANVREKDALISKCNEEINKIKSEVNKLDTEADAKSFFAARQRQAMEEYTGQQGWFKKQVAQFLGAVYEIASMLPFNSLIP